MSIPTESGAAVQSGDEARWRLTHAAAGRHGRPGQRAAVQLLCATGLLQRRELLEHVTITRRPESGERFPSGDDDHLQIDWSALLADQSLASPDTEPLLRAAAALDAGDPVDLAALSALSARRRPTVLGALAAALDAEESVEIRAAHNPQFDFMRDVIGDDLVVGGVVYSCTEWTHDGEGDVRRLSDRERAERYRAQLAESSWQLAAALRTAETVGQLSRGEVLAVLDPLARLLADARVGTPGPGTTAVALTELGYIRAWPADAEAIAFTHPDRAGTGALHVPLDPCADDYDQRLDTLCGALATAYRVSGDLVRHALFTGAGAAIREQCAENEHRARPAPLSGDAPF